MYRAAVQEATNLDNLIHVKDDPDQITPYSRHHLLALSEKCTRLREEVEPLHERFIDTEPMRIRLDQITAFHARLLDNGVKSLTDDDPFEDLTNFIVNLGFPHYTAEVDILPFLKWIVEDPER